MATKKAAAHDSYPLRTVSRLTGLSADIIRAWEKRYGVVSPIRGARGARLYSRDDIDHLRMLARAIEGGRAIGDVAALSRAQLEALVAADQPAAPERVQEAAGGAQAILERALEAVERFDGQEVSEQLGSGLAALGSAEFVREVAAPLLVRVGDWWKQGRLSIGQEHMVSAALRNLLQAVIRLRGRPAETSVLLATPAGERHEGGLLMVALLLVDAGLGVSYLGADMPAREIVAAAQAAAVSVVGLSLAPGENHKVALREVREVERRLPAETQLWLGGSGAAAVARQLKSARVHLVEDLTELDAKARALREGLVLG